MIAASEGCEHSEYCATRIMHAQTMLVLADLHQQIIKLLEHQLPEWRSCMIRRNSKCHAGLHKQQCCFEQATNDLPLYLALLVAHCCHT